jgi:uncharacterized protein YuzE
MKISYDANTDVLSLIFGEADGYLRELGEGFIAEYDDSGMLIRVDIPSISNTPQGKDVFRQLVVEGISPFGKNDPLIILPRLFENVETLE